ncbi:MAG: 4-(cytidine 5'-diphospho)-2-C-methyl-D-erythritol kinase [Alistipes sp.]
MILYANCKINLGLDVLRRRADGYHDLETVMLPVRGLYDTVEVTRMEGQNPIFTSSGLVVDCPVEENICLKAYRLMQSQFNVGAVRIALDKRVPFGAGLGGGSSDGTAVLGAINALFNLQLTSDELIALAMQLGSDTAFFVHNQPQLCTSRGEVMTPFDPELQGIWLVVVKPQEGVSTREAYAGVAPKLPALPLVERLRLPLAKWQGVVKNDFEPSVFAAHPKIALLRDSLLHQGALYASMSGSGSAVFGLFTTKPKYTPPFDGVYLYVEQI